MQYHKKAGSRKNCEGKMLSGWVNKYLNERGTFDTEVCSYSFGMDDAIEDSKQFSEVVHSPLPAAAGGDDHHHLINVINLGESKARFPPSNLRTLSDYATAVAKKESNVYFNNSPSPDAGDMLHDMTDLSSTNAGTYAGHASKNLRLNLGGGTTSTSSHH